MADIVEIADERDVAPYFREAVTDMRHGGRRFGAIDGNPDKLGSRAGKRRDLGHGPLDVGGIRIGHGLDSGRRAAANQDCIFAGADPYADGVAAGQGACLVGVDGLGGGRKGELCHMGPGLLKKGACRTYPAGVSPF